MVLGLEKGFEKMFEKFLVLWCLVVSTLAGCATTKSADPAGSALVATPKTDGTRCTREPVKAWKITPSPFGGEHKSIDGQMSILVDVSPIDEDGYGGYMVAIYSINHRGDSGWNYMYLPPHSTNKPLERFIRCMKGSMEWAMEEWLSRPFGYTHTTPAPAAGKKGGK